MKKLENYLHLYPGVTLRSKTGFVILLGVLNYDPIKIVVENGSEAYKTELGEYLPELRHLSDMTEEEAEEFALSCLNSPHAPEHWEPVTSEELQMEFVKNDGGLMLDDDVDLYFNVSCRCLDGYIAIMKDGRIGMANESDTPTREMQPVDDVYGKVLWLLSKHFDLFNLIPEGLAIDKTTLKLDEIL